MSAIRYSREKLLSAGLSSSSLPNGAKAGGTDLPSGWLGNVLSAFPDIKRSTDEPHPLPIKWEEAFASSVVEGYVIGVSDQGLYSVPTTKHQGLYSIRENNNNNNNGSPPYNQEVKKKKNFLEVLRPSAPIREWDEKLGEWVEKEAGRG